MDLTVVIVAWYLTILSPHYDYPILVGPYESREECKEVEKFTVKLSYITDVKIVVGGCSMMSVPQNAELLEIP